MITYTQLNIPCTAVTEGCVTPCAPGTDSEGGTTPMEKNLGTELVATGGTTLLEISPPLAALRPRPRPGDRCRTRGACDFGVLIVDTSVGGICAEPCTTCLYCSSSERDAGNDTPDNSAGRK